MKKHKSTEEFLEEVKKLTGGQFEVMGIYHNKITEIQILHKKCGNAFMVKPTMFLSCPICKVCKEKVNLENVFNIHNHQEFMNYISPKITDKWIIEGQYSDMDTRIKVTHLQCGKTESVQPKKFIINQICQYCDGGLNTSTDDFKQKVFKKFGNEYEILSEYKNNKIDIKIRDTKCGKSFKIQPSQFLSKTFVKCPKCGKEHIFTNINKNIYKNNKLNELDEEKAIDLIQKLKAIQFNENINLEYVYDVCRSFVEQMKPVLHKNE